MSEEKKMGIYEKLSHIQNELNAPKNLWNDYGKYYYRNAESILESAKPVCAKYRTTLIVEDEIVVIGERYYLKAIASLVDWDSVEQIENVAYAREAESKTGMDASQLTGSCSSYARKYCLNGLFNIDDVKDADSNEQANEIQARKGNQKKEEPKKQEQKKKEEAKPSAPRKATMKQIDKIKTLYTDAQILTMVKNIGCASIMDITIEQASKMIEAREVKINA